MQKKFLVLFFLLGSPRLVLAQNNQAPDEPKPTTIGKHEIDIDDIDWADFNKQLEDLRKTKNKPAHFTPESSRLFMIRVLQIARLMKSPEAQQYLDIFALTVSGKKSWASYFFDKLQLTTTAEDPRPVPEWFPVALDRFCTRFLPKIIGALGEYGISKLDPAEITQPEGTHFPPRIIDLTVILKKSFFIACVPDSEKIWVEHCSLEWPDLGPKVDGIWEQIRTITTEESIDTGMDILAYYGTTFLLNQFGYPPHTGLNLITAPSILGVSLYSSNHTGVFSINDFTQFAGSNLINALLRETFNEIRNSYFASKSLPSGFFTRDPQKQYYNVLFKKKTIDDHIINSIADYVGFDNVLPYEKLEQNSNVLQLGPKILADKNWKDVLAYKFFSGFSWATMLGAKAVMIYLATWLDHTMYANTKAYETHSPTFVKWITFLSRKIAQVTGIVLVQQGEQFISSLRLKFDSMVLKQYEAVLVNRTKQKPLGITFKGQIPYFIVRRT